MGSGGGGSGRSLSTQELQLIDAQRAAFQQQQGQQGARFGLTQAASQQAGNLTPQLQQQIQASRAGLGLIGDSAIREGNRRRSMEEQLVLSQQLVPNDINALAGTIQDPNFSGITNAALSRAQQSTAPLGTSTLRAIQTAGLRGSQALPLSGNIRDLNALAGQQFVDPQIQGIMGLRPEQSVAGQRVSGLASQLSGVGAAPGAAEAALSPGAISTLEQVQRGEVPNAVQSLFSGTNTAERSQLENQFDAARQRLIESGVTGGALTRAMAGLEGQRALGVAQQVENRSSEARNLSSQLLGQATTFGLNQPFARQQLRAQALQGAGGLQQGAGQLGINELLARTQGLQAAGQLGLGQAQTQAGLLQSAADVAARQGELQQGFLNQARLGATDLSQAGIQTEQLRNQNLGLAGQLAAQQSQAQIQAVQARQNALMGGIDAARAIGGQLGQGADQLGFQTAPALLNQQTQLAQLLAQSPGISADILRGGSGGGQVDLSGALAAASGAAGAPQGPSQGERALAGGLSGAATGATIGSVVPGIGTAIGALAGGAIGIGSSFL